MGTPIILMRRPWRTGSRRIFFKSMLRNLNVNVVLRRILKVDI